MADRQPSEDPRPLPDGWESAGVGGTYGETRHPLLDAITTQPPSKSMLLAFRHAKDF